MYRSRNGTSVPGIAHVIPDMTPVDADTVHVVSGMAQVVVNMENLVQ